MLWNIKVYEEDGDQLITEHEDIPDYALMDLLTSLRKKMTESYYDVELQERYAPDNMILITLVIEED
jgi:hypothetical protein